ncbi:MAG: DUF4870 domain-containing protein [Sedimentisphaerales bacterium]|nr:DUF4870 domain-containing protein [Sedimentisphaerales bacterium]
MNDNVESSDQANNTPQQPQTSGATSGTSDAPQNAKNMALLCHLLGLLTCFIGPLVIWLLKKDEHPFIDSQGKEALNFQISVTLASIAAGILSVFCIGFLLFPIIGVLDLVFSIMACVKSSQGVDYKYPISIRLIK